VLAGGAPREPPVENRADGTPRTLAVSELDEDELPSLKDLLTPDFTLPASAEPPHSEDGQRGPRREGAQKLSGFVFDVFAKEEDDDESSRMDARSGESTIREFPTPDMWGHPLSVPESPRQPALTEAASGRKTGGCDDFSEDYDRPLLRTFLAHPTQVIDLTVDNDEGDDIIEVSWLSSTPAAQCHERLTPLLLTDRCQAVHRIPPLPTLLLAEVIHTNRRRPYNVVYSGHTWQKETTLEEWPSIVSIAT
jgi:hypothetical protein